MSNKIVNKVLFGRKVRDAREKAGMTQFSLADSIGISQNFLGDIERGNKLPSIETLIRMSNILKVSLDTLFSASLDNILSEPEEIIYTDRQLNIIRQMIKSITDNFDE